MGDEVSDEIAERSIRQYAPDDPERLPTVLPYVGEPWEEFEHGSDLEFQIVLIQRRMDRDMRPEVYASVKGLPVRDLRVLRDAENGQIVSDSIRDL